MSLIYCSIYIYMLYEFVQKHIYMLLVCSNGWLKLGDRGVRLLRLPFQPMGVGLFQVPAYPNEAVLK